MRVLVVWLLFVGLLRGAPALADTPTPTITPTPSATVDLTQTSATPTATSTQTLELYVYGTVPASGQAYAIAYTLTAGEMLTATLNLIVIGMLLFLVFLVMVRNREH